MLGTNLLLDSLSPNSRDLILSSATNVDLPVRTLLQEEEEHPRFAYFLTSGLGSVVLGLKEGGSAEVALIGHEGLSGSYSLLGFSAPSTHCFMQIAGSGYRVPFQKLQELFLSSEEIRERVLHFVQMQLLTTSQLSACNGLHQIEKRLARWLLMVQDRLGEDVIHLTHEFLGQMLGVHRPTLTMAVAVLEKTGMIENGRARIKIQSRESLKRVACDCYPYTERILRDLYQQPTRPLNRHTP